MAVVHAAPEADGGWSQVLTTDFCPWANRFVYWLKEPVGWFVLATAVSVLIGISFSPVGWTLAASLTAIMVVGMAWPWVAVRVTTCGLRPAADAVHEDSDCRMIVSVRNCVPLPIWGLVVEGYLTGDADDVTPTVGLACVPPLCTADYSVNVRPSLRGRYPVTRPMVACSFPFGIWTARRSLTSMNPLTVWPKVHPVAGRCPLVGEIRSDVGDGQRGGGVGDFVGVRTFRRGDSAKQINWIASARCDSLIVTERGGPQTVEVDVWLDTEVKPGLSNTRTGGQRSRTRESLARRVRVAASLLVSLHQSRVAARVTIGDQRLTFGHDAQGWRRLLDALADVPDDGRPCGPAKTSGMKPSILISGATDGDVCIRIENPRGGRRAGGQIREIRIAASDDLAAAVAQLWKEVRDVDQVA